MRKFNLEEAKAGKPVCTRDGRKARIVCFDARGGRYPMLALLDMGRCEHAHWYNADGYLASDGDENPLDLMMASEHHEGWINVYQWDDIIHSRIGSVIYNSREAAISNKGDDYITTIKIEWEE